MAEKIGTINNNIIVIIRTIIRILIDLITAKTFHDY